MVGTNTTTDYRQLSQYSELIGGTVGTFRGSDGSLRMPMVPAWAPPMAIVTLPVEPNGHKLGPGALQHGQKDASGTGYFDVTNAYGSTCTKYKKTKCGGNK